MKTRGFTLIETIASISIILIIYSISSSFIVMGTKLKDEIENTECVYEIENFITYSKEKCRFDGEEGNIFVDREDGKIIFHKDNYIERVLMLNKDIKIISESNNILIGSNGRLKESTSILIKDKFNNIKATAIAVGVDTISIKSLNEVDKLV